VGTGKDEAMNSSGVLNGILIKGSMFVGLSTVTAEHWIGETLDVLSISDSHSVHESGRHHTAVLFHHHTSSHRSVP